MTRILVLSPARLHFGIINPFNRKFKMYGCIGLAIDRPRTIVEVEEYSEDVIESDRYLEVKYCLERLRKYFNIPKVKIKTIQSIPKHVGLGSTTQLMLSIAKGLLTLSNIEVSIIEVAKILGRGKVSGIGTYIFQYGGLIIDSGKDKIEEFPKLHARIEFPENWYFIITIPSKGRGLSEEEEEKIFSQNIDIPEELILKAQEILYRQFVPAIIDKDIEKFGKALTELQIIVGKMFINIQKDIYNPSCVKVINILKKLDVLGIGQSSWGPTIYALIDSLRRGIEIVKYLIEVHNISAMLAKPINYGAIVLKI